MNVIDKRKMLEGLTFFLSVSRDATEQEMDAVIAARDALKSAGLYLTDDNGNIVIKRRESKKVCFKGIAL